MKINQRHIGQGNPVYIIAEMSANHNQRLSEALKIIDAAKDAGADAVKLQTYTPETLTIDCDNDYFRIKDTIWKNENLFSLYSRAATPWEWHDKLKAHANGKGMDLFSTPFDESAVDFLEELHMPAYKIASFELVDLPLLQRIARTGKPVVMSTGMGTLAEIQEAVDTLRSSGCRNLALLKCTSAYPAQPEEMNLQTIPHLSGTFDVPAGLSDHTLGIEVPVAAVALGATIIEKHLTLSRDNPGPDVLFSLTPEEFKRMVEAVRNAQKAIGCVNYTITEKQKSSRAFRRSLFVVNNMKKGDLFSDKNVRSIRPGFGLHTRYLDTIIGRQAKIPIEKGTPLSWEIVG
jgi:pseudaminic acid synthase